MASTDPIADMLTSIRNGNHRFFEKVDVPVLGIIENMSTHICSQCGHEEHIFGSGGGEQMSKQYGVDLLALSFQLLSNEEKSSFPTKYTYKSIVDGALDIEFMIQPPNTHFDKELPVEEALYEEYYCTDGETVRSINGYAEKTGYRIITVES